jgi:hypothetical protein
MYLSGIKPTVQARRMMNPCHESKILFGQDSISIFHGKDYISLSPLRLISLATDRSKETRIKEMTDGLSASPLLSGIPKEPYLKRMATILFECYSNDADIQCSEKNRVKPEKTQHGIPFESITPLKSTHEKEYAIASELATEEAFKDIPIGYLTRIAKVVIEFFEDKQRGVH